MADDGACKVGVSRDPIKRKKAIENQRGRPLAIFVVYPTWRAFEIERQAHLLLDPWAIGYEWFRCSPFKAAAGVEMAAEEADLTIKAHQLRWNRPYPEFTFAPVTDEVSEPSPANVALWRLAKEKVAPEFYWPSLLEDDEEW